MATLLVAIAVLVASAFLFQNALPQEGQTRWFIGTIWEPFIVVALVMALVVSAGVAVWSIIDLMS